MCVNKHRKKDWKLSPYRKWVWLKGRSREERVIFFLFLFTSIISLFPGDASSKEPACQCRSCKRLGFNPWVGRIPCSRIWQPSPVSCLENPLDRGVWQAVVHGVTKSQTWLKRLSTHTSIIMIANTCCLLSTRSTFKFLKCSSLIVSRWGNSGNSERLYFWGLQNHCRWWLQSWNKKTLTSWKKSCD